MKTKRNEKQKIKKHSNKINSNKNINKQTHELTNKSNESASNSVSKGASKSASNHCVSVLNGTTFHESPGTIGAENTSRSLLIVNNNQNTSRNNNSESANNSVNINTTSLETSRNRSICVQTTESSAKLRKKVKSRQSKVKNYLRSAGHDLILRRQHINTVKAKIEDILEKYERIRLDLDNFINKKTSIICELSEKLLIISEITATLKSLRNKYTQFFFKKSVTKETLKLKGKILELQTNFLASRDKHQKWLQKNQICQYLHLKTESCVRCLSVTDIFSPVSLAAFDLM